jgi:glycosidase
MPVLKPRPDISDGGYAVMDYRAIAPALGDLEDLRSLAERLRIYGISLCLDLVLNHTAKEHEWAQRAIAGEQEYLDYYYTFSDRTLPDAYERTLPEVLPDFAPSNFSWYPQMADGGRWVWTTFNEFQWDLNYSNPTVFREIIEIVFFLANQGVDILRLDAVPYIWKRMGTKAGLESALAKQDDAEIDLAIRRILLLHSIIMSYGGIPLIYMGDELGLLSDRSYLNDPAKARDSRWMHRPPMDWAKAISRHDSTSIVERIYQGLSKLISARKSTSILHSFGSIEPIQTDNEYTLALYRRNPSSDLLVLANFHERAQSVKVNLLRYEELGANVYNLLVRATPLKISDGRIYLESYENL